MSGPSHAYLAQLVADYARELDALRGRHADTVASARALEDAGDEDAACEAWRAADDLADQIACCEARDREEASFRALAERAADLAAYHASVL